MEESEIMEFKRMFVGDLNKEVIAFANTIKPAVTMFVRYDRLTLEGKDVLKITINKESMVPYYVASKGMHPEGVYLRQGTISVPASETVFMKMIREMAGDAFEEERSPNRI